MTQFLQHLFLCSFWIFGIRTLFSHDHLLYPLYELAEKHLSQYVIKPTVGCVICQSSVHGSIWFFIFLLPGFDWYYVFPFMICLCGLNSIIDHAIN